MENNSKKSLKINLFGYTDIGKKRPNNEDAIFFKNITGRDDLQALLCVCDGMGGHASGELASSLAAKIFSMIERTESGSLKGKYFTILNEALQFANKKIYEIAQKDENKRGMGTTITAGLIAENTLHIAHVGDSRAYLFRENNSHKLTSDHTYVAELVRNGLLTEQESENHPQKNIITRALGNNERIEIDTYKIYLRDGDRYIFCSDGLTNYINDEEIRDIIFEHKTPEDTAKALINLANLRGGADNISVISLFVGEKLPVFLHSQKREIPLHSITPLVSPLGVEKKRNISYYKS